MVPVFEAGLGIRRPDVEQAARNLLDEMSEVVAEHREIAGHNVLGADDRLEGGTADLRHALIVNDRRRAVIVEHLTAAAERLGDATGNRIDAVEQARAGRWIEAAESAMHLDAVGNDVPGGAAVDGADAEHG